MSTALVHWTNRVADLKFRELEVSTNYERKVTGYAPSICSHNHFHPDPWSRSAFKKWKDLCIRHVEELSLMESYQDVKREGRLIDLYLLLWD